MSAFQKPSQAALLDYGSTHSLNDAASYSSYGQGPYVTTPFVPSPMADQASQISDSAPYLSKQEYSSSYEESRSPMLGNIRQLPEVVSYNPQRGCDGTRVFVQIQSPYDLHSSSYAPSYLEFGTKRCECIPHFLGFQGSVFQYALSVDAPPFSSTGSPSPAVSLYLTMDGQNDCPSTTLNVGVYTYERISLPSPSDEPRKRRMSSYSDNCIIRPAKKSAGQEIQPKEPSDNYSYRDNRSASFSPYMHGLPGGNGFVVPYHPAPSPRLGSVQYQPVATPQQPAMRPQTPLTPSWSPSFVAVSNEARNPSLTLAPGPLHQRHRSSPAREENPTLIRTSTLQANGVGQAPSFNPYAMYPSKAVLKLNGDLDSMTENWTREERDTQRRLVHFTRVQNGSAIHADFRPVTPEDRLPNSICISCIYWSRRKECFITSVDTIYLLESLVGVRFTVEEKNRIRRNLEGFRPLTVSKAKADSEDFFKVIMGFPAPKPRNIEKDVKVFPWKILAHALKKIIGKYSASYSSTAGALPTPINSNYASMGTGSDSGSDPQVGGSPQSLPDTLPPSSYGPSIAVPAYSPQTDHSGRPASSASEFRVMLPAVSQPYASIAPSYSYPAYCQPQSQSGFAAPVSRPSWEMNSLIGPPVSGASSNAPCYSYLAPTPYSLPDASQ